MRISSMQSEAARRAARKHGKLAPLKLRSSATSAHRPRMRACSSQQRFADRNRAAGQRGRQPTYGGAHLFCEGTIGPTEFCVINVLHHDQGLATTDRRRRRQGPRLCCRNRFRPSPLPCDGRSAAVTPCSVLKRATGIVRIAPTPVTSAPRRRVHVKY